MKIVLVIPVQTASLERGFSLVKRVKNDWRSRLQPKTVTQLILIKLNGPELKDYNPCPAIVQWWKAGPWRRRTSMLPHGLRARDLDESKSESDSSGSD